MKDNQANSCVGEIESQEFDWKEALRLAYEEQDTLMLSTMLANGQVSIHTVFSYFLDPTNKDGSKERAELQRRKEFAKVFFTENLAISEKVMMILLLQHGNVHIAWAYALLNASKRPEEDPSVLEIRRHGALLEMAAGELIKKKAFTAIDSGKNSELLSHMLEKILSLEEITGEVAASILHVAAQCHDHDTVNTLRSRNIHLKNLFRAAILLPDIKWGFNLLKRNKNEILENSLSYSLDKFYLTLAKYGNVKQLDKATKLVEETIEADLKNILLGNLTIGYARLQEIDKLKKVIKAFLPEEVLTLGLTYTAEESRMVRLGNHSGAVLFNAIESGCLETVKVIVEAGADVNIRVPETKNFPLKAALVAGKKEIAEYLIQMGATYPDRETLANLDIAIQYFTYKRDHLKDVEAGIERYRNFLEKKKRLNCQNAAEDEGTIHHPHSNTTLPPPQDLAHKFLQKQIIHLVTERNKDLYETELQSLTVKVLNEIDSSPVGKEPGDHTYLYRDEGKLLRTKHCKEMVEKCVHSAMEKECIHKQIIQRVTELGRDLHETERKSLIIKIQNEIDFSPIGEGPEDNTYLYQIDGLLLCTENCRKMVDTCIQSMLVKESMESFQKSFFGKRLIEEVISKVVGLSIRREEEKPNEFYKKIITSVWHSIFDEENIGKDKFDATVLYWEKTQFKLGRTRDWQKSIESLVENAVQKHQETLHLRTPPFPHIPHIRDIPQCLSDTFLEIEQSKVRKRRSLTEYPLQKNRIHSARGADEDAKNKEPFPPKRYPKKEEPENPPTSGKSSHKRQPSKGFSAQLTEQRQKNSQQKDAVTRN